MTETTIDLQLLAVFAAVAEHASFSKAAQKLGVAKGTVSRSIASLESSLGVELLHRTTHTVALSTAGAELFDRTRGHLAGLRAAMSGLPERDDAPSGLLRMTAPPDFGAIVLPSVLAAFARRYANVRFDVRLSIAQVDLVKEGYDLAIRVTAERLTDSSLTVRRVGRGVAGLYASPTYLARRGRPKQLGDAQHTWVMHRVALRLLGLDPERAQFLVDDFLVVRALLSEGVGIGLIPSFVAQSHVREGLLEEVSVPGVSLSSGEIVMVYPSHGKPPKKVTAFRDSLVEALRVGP